RNVLTDVSLRARPWEILAIVGPSGAGKSSLLEILAGKLTHQSGSIYVNGAPLEKSRFKKMSGYVTQKDTLFPLLTVEETLRFTAELRLNLPAREIDARVESLMNELGLAHVAGERIGDDRVRGISGGERRRVSIGMEIIHSPEVVILDEPTSGLDSASALQIVDILKTMSETKGRTIILSIHQPGVRIVKLLNSVLLLAGGAVLHHGTVDLLAVNIAMMGLEIPNHVNVVEFAIESIETLKLHHHQNSGKKQGTLISSGKNAADRFTLRQLFHHQTKISDEESIQEGHDSPPPFANSRLRETAILTQRFWKNICRTKELFAGRSISMLISGAVLGSIFYHLKDNFSGTQERIGLFAFILTFLLSSTTEALPIFLQEKEILLKETSNGSYRISSYAMANGIAYLPFLLILSILFALPLYWLVGLNRSFVAFAHFLLLIWLILYTANSVVVCFSSLVPNFIVGNSAISAVMGAFFLFSGYFVSEKGMPRYWIFMHYISLFKYPFEGFLVNEFSAGKCVDFVMGECVLTGEDVLREQGYGDGGGEGRWRNYVIMFCFVLVYRFMGYIILKFKCSSSS
ncbi:hypothetical protein M569_16219, partial [Genlisea aurea]